jgi:hypothetical protein
MDIEKLLQEAGIADEPVAQVLREMNACLVNARKRIVTLEAQVLPSEPDPEVGLP